MDNVKIWKEEVIIPTYEVGEADKLPMFLEKRVYQGSSGKIYPYPTIEKISDNKVDKKYIAVYLENEYLKIMILPELGGRIQRAFDKTNQYDFVYYNHVIKPALVGLTGPWISGGIEFNWPQHHRPTTFMPVDYELKENEDGSRTLEIHDVDRMYGTEMMAKYTLYPGKAYIEINGQLYNGTSFPQTFLWWANPAVSVNDYTQSIFPPDVHAVMDHGKRDVSKFPIATGIYYKHDYSEGVDISRYKNIPVPTSYMAEKSKYDFVGGYDYSVQAGILHIADHHISPGKKQWTWGCGEFGKAWDRNLTDEDGPYIELMTGMYTDNQPDFAWLKPFEEKSFKQYFMPYKKVGQVKNASLTAVLNMEVKEQEVYVCIYATEEIKQARVVLKQEENTVADEQTDLSPVHIFEKSYPICVEKEADVRITVYGNDGKILVSYSPEEKKIEKIPNPAEAIKEPEEIWTNEELYLAGMHIEQYRHATYLPDPYYLEALKRDKGDMRANNAYGLLLLRRGCFDDAEKYFRAAVKRATWKNPNPYNSEPYYNLGLTLFYQERMEEAYDAFFKATWTNEQQEMSFYYLAAITARKEEYQSALIHIEKALVKNSHNLKARAMKSYLLKKIGRLDKAKEWTEENLKLNEFDFISRFEMADFDDSLKKGNKDKANRLMRQYSENYLQTAREYAEFGAYQNAIEVLDECTEHNPMLDYYKAYYLGKIGKENESALDKAEKECPDYCFPNKLEDILVLSSAIQQNPKGARAYYYLGNLYYDKMQYGKAIALWEKAADLDETFPITFRNLALAYFNKCGAKEKAQKMLEKAFSLEPSNSRIFLELDQLYKKQSVSPEKRLALYNQYLPVVMERDMLYIEYVTLYNLLGEYEKAYELIQRHRFHPWEGGEGKIVAQYKTALIGMAEKNISLGQLQEARENLENALVYPENLGEGKLEGTKDNNIYYMLGLVYDKLNQTEQAVYCYRMATAGAEEVAGVMYYNDQPADMILFQGFACEKLG